MSLMVASAITSGQENASEENLKKEWLQTNPDVIVYLPKGEKDGDNFLQFGPRAALKVVATTVPYWFSKPKEILDTQGRIFGPKGTASVAMYPSLTDWKGRLTLWYPDRKHFLLGKYITDEMLRDMNVPE